MRISLFFSIAILGLLLPAGLNAQATFEKLVSVSKATNDCRMLLCQEFTDGKGFVCVNQDRGFGADSYLQLRCFDVAGNIIWEKSIELEHNTSLQSFSLGRKHELIIGLIGASGADVQRTAGIIKLDRAGNLIWQKFYQPSGYQQAGGYAVYEQANGELLMYGFCSSPDRNGHYVLRLSADGKVLDHRYIHRTGIWGVAKPAIDGGLYIFCSEGVMKVDQNLSVLWFKSLPAGMQHTQVCATDENNNFYTVLSTTEPSNSALLRWNQAGQLEWARRIKFVNIRNLEIVQQRMFLLGGSDLHELDIAGNWVQSQRYNNFFVDMAKACGNQFWLMGLAAYNSHVGMAMALVNKDGSSFCSVPGNNPDGGIMASPLVINSLGSYNEVLPFTEKNMNLSMLLTSSSTDTICPGQLSSTFSLGPDTAFCSGDSIKLDAGVDAAFYEWSNGALSRSIKIEKGGLYWVKVKGTCSGNDVDTLLVTERSAPDAQFTLNPLPALPGDELTLTDISQGIQQRTWTLPGAASSSDSVIKWQVPNSGRFKFSLKVCDSNTCCKQQEQELEVNFFSLYIPSAFSPDADGLNDVFAPQGYGIGSYELRIFNRWGQQLFEAENRGWDGFYHSQLAEEGMYFYLLRVRNQEGRYLGREGYVYLLH